MQQNLLEKLLNHLIKGGSPGGSPSARINLKDIFRFKFVLTISASPPPPHQQKELGRR